MHKGSWRLCAAIGVVLLIFIDTAPAAVITASYVNIQTSDNVNFNAAGNVINFGTNTAALYNLPVGKFFRFGISVSVSGNPNPAFSDGWEDVGIDPQPMNLGIAAIAMRVFSSDPTGARAAAVQGAPLAGRNASKARFVAGGTDWSYRDPGDVLGDLSAGTVNALGTGEVGLAQPIFTFNTSVDYSMGSRLSRFVEPGEVWFDSLSYQVLDNQPVELVPALDPEFLHLWRVVSPGDPEEGEPPTYTLQLLNTSSGPNTDSVVNVPALVINPEPSAGFAVLAFLTCSSLRRARHRHP